MSSLLTWEEFEATLLGKEKFNGSLADLRIARWARALCMGLLVIAGATLLLVKIGVASMFHAEAHMTLWSFLFRAGVCLMHLYYLQLVLNLLVFHVPVQSFRLQTLLIPVLLVIAYSTGVYDIVSVFPEAFPEFIRNNTKLLKFVSILTFIAVYYYWFLRDFCEANHSSGGSRRVRKLWATLDLAVFVVLVSFAIYKADISAPFEGWSLGPKDWCVAGCIITYQGVSRLSWWVEQDFYPDKYQTYLAEQIDVRLLPVTGRDPIAETRQWLAVHPSAHVIDFGAADSRRLLWFLQKIFPAPPTVPLEVVRYDINGDWENKDRLTEDGSQVVGSAAFSHRMDKLVADARSAPCLIHASHVLYDRQAVCDLCQFIKRLEVPCCVVIRGYGDSIFRHVSVFQSLIGARSKNVSHLWESVYLPYIVKCSGLEPATRREWISANVEQNMPKTTRALDALEGFLRVLYGIAWTEMSRVFLNEIWSNMRGTKVANPDVIYFFSRPDA